MSVIRAVIFDLGRVIVDFDHSIAARKMSEFCRRSPKEIYALFFDSDLTGSFEEGAIAAPDFFNRLRQRLQADITFDQFVPLWNEIFFITEQNKQVLQIAHCLQKTRITAVLSNINLLHYQYLKQGYDIFGPFHHVFASCELGCKKPDNRIYQLVLDKLGVAAQEAFYTDDRPELIAAARQMGIRSFVYKNPQKLKTDLVEAGISWDELAQRCAA